MNKIDDRNEIEPVYTQQRQLSSLSRSSCNQKLLQSTTDNPDNNCSKEGISTAKSANMLENVSIFKNRNIVVDLLAIFFGIGTWIGINGTFIQLPLLIAEAPEGPNLPSYLNIMVQLGNLGPFFYTLILSNKKIDVHLIYGLLAIGTVSSLLTGLFYNKTAIIFGTNLSAALYLLTFLTALNGCTSSVLFMPYMGRFRLIYLITFFVGEGLSGLIPSVVALFQGIGGSPQCVLYNITAAGESTYMKYTPPPKFGSSTYFFFIFAMMFCSCISFLLLDNLKSAKKEYAAVQVTQGNNYSYGKSGEREIEDEQSTTNINDDPMAQISSRQYKCFLFLIGTVSFFSNGIFNSVESFSCLPYSTNAYHLTVTLSAIANPVACFLAFFLPHSSLRSIATLSGICTCLTVYVFLTAIMGAASPFRGTAYGSAIVITAWTLLIGAISYLKLSIASVMRAQGGKSLIWTGAFSQLGSAIGSVVIFLLINYVHIFPELRFDEDEC